MISASLDVFYSCFKLQLNLKLQIEQYGDQNGYATVSDTDKNRKHNNRNNKILLADNKI
jgi:hypothetical protein